MYKERGKKAHMADERIGRRKKKKEEVKGRKAKDNGGKKRKPATDNERD